MCRPCTVGVCGAGGGPARRYRSSADGAHPRGPHPPGVAAGPRGDLLPCLRHAKPSTTTDLRTLTGLGGRASGWCRSASTTTPCASGRSISRYVGLGARTHPFTKQTLTMATAPKLPYSTHRSPTSSSLRRARRAEAWRRPREARSNFPERTVISDTYIDSRRSGGCGDRISRVLREEVEVLQTARRSPVSAGDLAVERARSHGPRRGPKTHPYRDSGALSDADRRGCSIRLTGPDYVDHGGWGTHVLSMGRQRDRARLITPGRGPPYGPSAPWRVRRQKGLIVGVDALERRGSGSFTAAERRSEVDEWAGGEGGRKDHFIFGTLVMGDLTPCVRARSGFVWDHAP